MIKIAYNELLAKAEAAERNFNLEEAAKLYKQVLDTQIDKSDLENVAKLYEKIGNIYIWAVFTAKTKDHHKKMCLFCGKRMHIAGPLWLDVLYDKKFTENMLFESHNNILGTKKRIIKLLSNILEEINAPPTFYVIDKICEILGEPSRAKKAVIDNLNELGFQATSTHFHPKGIKTDASVEDVKSAIKNVN